MILLKWCQNGGLLQVTHFQRMPEISPAWYAYLFIVIHLGVGQGGVSTL